MLTHARAVIRASFTDEAPLQPAAFGSDKLREKRGCFVTLHKQGALRGCIGSIEPLTSLVECVTENARNAAFQDPRFAPLGLDELPEVDIEVSVLTVPEPLEFTDGEDLKRKLKPGVHGVILSRGFHRATFLPQVWEQLPDPQDFLEHLCLKAGLDRNAWRDDRISVKIYQAQYFCER